MTQIIAEIKTAHNKYIVDEDDIMNIAKDYIKRRTLDQFEMAPSYAGNEFSGMIAFFHQEFQRESITISIQKLREIVKSAFVDAKEVSFKIE